MIFEEVRQILARQLEIPPEEITMDTDIVADLGADSLDVVELVMMIRGEIRHHDRGPPGQGPLYRAPDRGVY